jgi:DNA-binding transcriptional LysR family regulator
MNIHHLELFYYVAKHGGISEAVRNIPYGIQQPAVSGQILQLEDSLGKTLFHRRPFTLTPPGQELFRFIRPFFDDLDRVADRIRGDSAGPVRIAATSVILRDHLPQVLAHLRTRFPRLKITLREGIQPQMEQWLQNQEVDLAVTLIEGRASAGIKTMSLMELPLALLVPKTLRIKSAAEIWGQDRISETLISLPSNEGITKRFQSGLARRGIAWPVGIEVDSLDLIETYVSNGFGIGLSVAVPKARISARVHVLKLDDFAPVVVGVLWRGRLTPLTEAFLGEFKRRAQQLLT